MPPRHDTQALELLPAREPATLPHRIEPLEGESLIGFVLRCDWVNRFPLWTTFKMVARQRTQWRALGAAAWASGSAVDLRALGGLTGNPLSGLRALTFLPELDRLVGERDVPIEALGALDHGPSFCPACWRESRLIRRTFLLPEVSICPWHDRRLLNLRPCCLDNGFRRTPCVSDHDDLLPLTDVVMARQRDIYRIWQMLLEPTDPEVVGAGYRVVGRVGKRGDPALEAIARVQRGRSSLGRLVHALAALHIEPGLLRDLLESERTRAHCPNASCDFYAHAGDGPDPLARLRKERHCTFCGTRYVGRRILSTFDLEHGAARPTPTQVRRARRRLGRWKIALHLACAEIAESGRPITVGAAFRRARVPLNANLRAERLGLVALVRDAARRQRLAGLVEPFPFARVTMADYAELVGLAVARDWDEIPRWAHRYFSSPRFPTLMRTYDEQMAPVLRVLEPLFDLDWARTRPDVEAVLRVFDRYGRGLSDEWLRDRAGVFAVTPRTRLAIDQAIDERLRPRPRALLPGEPEVTGIGDFASWVVWAYQRPPEWPDRQQRRHTSR